MSSLKRAGTGIAVIAGLTGLCLAFAPLIVSELFMAGVEAIFQEPVQISVKDAGKPLGTVVDGFWRVQQIAPDTWAIGEPQSEPDNYAYLLVGKTRALLIDAGNAGGDIHAVLATLTALPVTVIPTHLHFDHSNGLKYFRSIAMIDIPQTRSRVEDGHFVLRRYDYLNTGAKPPAFNVTEWIKPDQEIDLGERRVTVLWTPGHTASSASIYDPRQKLLFTGDYIYTTSLYIFMPDSSLSAYVETADRLIEKMPADTVIYGAHCCRNDGPPGAPWLKMSDIKDLRQSIVDIRHGAQAGSRGFFLHNYPVNSQINIYTLYPLANH